MNLLGYGESMQRGRAAVAAGRHPAETLRPGSAPGVPLYRVVKQLLMETLVSGEWRPGTAIPAERVLAERFQVAIGTLRKAVDELVHDTILVRQQGRGTFVATHSRERFRFQFFHIVSRDGARHFPDVELLAFRKARAEEHESKALRLARGAGVFRITNLLSLRGAPAVVDAITLPQDRFPGLTERRLRERTGTLYHLYQTAFGITVVRSVERLRAARADDGIASHLGVRPGAPLLEIHRVAQTYEDDSVELRVSLVNTLDHEYVTDVGSVERA
jgi:GntR family transcriptional regulator